jgi:hypothetical protein
MRPISPDHSPHNLEVAAFMRSRLLEILDEVRSRLIVRLVELSVMPAPSSQVIRENLRRLAEQHATMMTVLEESIAAMEAELERSASTPPPRCPRCGRRLRTDGPLVDHKMKSIIHRGRRCFLGNTLPFRVFVRLAVRPDQYISCDSLLDEVWDARRERSSVRSVVKVLRSKLRDAGMADLTEIIDGHVPHHYGLMLHQLQ